MLRGGWLETILDCENDIKVLKDEIEKKKRELDKKRYKLNRLRELYSISYEDLKYEEIVSEMDIRKKILADGFIVRISF